MGNYMGLSIFRTNVIMKTSNLTASALLFDPQATAQEDGRQVFPPQPRVKMPCRPAGACTPHRWVGLL